MNIFDSVLKLDYIYKTVTKKEKIMTEAMGIKWQDYTTNEEVLDCANVKSIESLLMLRQLRWADHISCMDDSRMPKAKFYGELKQGRRDQGAPKKHFKDQLKDQLSLAEIDRSR